MSVCAILRPGQDRCGTGRLFGLQYFVVNQGGSIVPAVPVRFDKKRDKESKMKVVKGSIVVTLLLCTVGRAGEVRLSNKRALFPAENIANKRIWRPMFGARLNPGGTHLIYPIQIEDDSEDKDKLFDLEAFELATSKKQTISIELPRGYESVFTRFNCFNPSGERIAVFRPKLWIDRVLKSKQFSRETEIVLYDLKAQKLISTGLNARNQLGRFDNTGKFLYLIGERTSPVTKAALSDFKAKPTPLPGWVHSPCMYSEYSTVFVVRPVPPAAKQSPNTGRIRRRSNRAGLDIWNLSTENKIAELPVHQDNSILDDNAAQWTLDGRYIYYVDFKNKSGSNDKILLTRVWDVKSNEEKPGIVEALSAGPGPGKSTMVMARLENGRVGRMFLHDAVKNRTVDFGPPEARIIHAWGKKIVYVLPQDGKEMVYVADISPADEEPNDTK